MDAQPIWRDYIYGYKEDTMPLLNDKIQGQVRKTLEDMAGPVKLAMFTQSSEALECEMCGETRGLLEEIAALAYSYWEARGFQGGCPADDWTRAESELRELRTVAIAHA